MPELRKNIKFFGGGKNAPLVQLSTMVMDGEKVLDVIEMPEGSEFNTCLQLERDLYPLLPTNSTEVMGAYRYKQRNIVYNRINIIQALRIEFATDENDAFIIDKDSKFTHPVQASIFIDVLNDKYGYDMNDDDITITYTSENNYTVTAKPYSLSFFGQASVNFGAKDDVIPPVKIPSHDSVWDNAIINKATPFQVNGISVNPNSLSAQYNAGIAVMQFNSPDMAWAVWTGLLEGEASLFTSNPAPSISVANVNETLTVTGNQLKAKYIPFTISQLVPDFVNQVTAEDFRQTMFFTFPYAPTLDRMVSVWVDNVKTTIDILLTEAGFGGVRLEMDANGDARLIHNRTNDVRVMMRVNVPTLPALVRSNSRFIYGIQRNGNNIPLDSIGRELYCIYFKAEEIVVPDPSVMVPFVVNNQTDYTNALAKLNSTLVMPFPTYGSYTPSVQFVSDQYRLTATVESETSEARFPTFYRISKKDWDVIVSQPTNTVLGTYTPSIDGVPPTDISVGYLQASSVVETGTENRIVCILEGIPLHSTGRTVLNWSSTSGLYLTTTTALRFDIVYNRASLIRPVDLDEDLLRTIVSDDITPEEFNLMWTRQSEVLRFISQINGQWSINYEYSPFNPSDTTLNPIDKDGELILQLMSIPSTAMLQIQSIAVSNPSAVIIRLVDTGNLNTRNYTALDIVQESAIDGSGNGYLLERHSKVTGNNVHWTFTCDYDGIDPVYRETVTDVYITDSVIDNPTVPFDATIQECSTKEQYDEYVLKASEALEGPYFTWARHKFDLNFNDTAGTFTRYGTETPVARTVGRLLLGPEYRQWLSTGDYTQFPDPNPVVITYTNTASSETYILRADYLRKYANEPGGIPIPMPVFNPTPASLVWTWSFDWFGVGNPPRPAPSPLPNLRDGTLSPAMTIETLPFLVEDSLFNFSSNYTLQEEQVMRANLIREGKTIESIDTIVKDYYSEILSDGTNPVTGRNAQIFNAVFPATNPTQHLVLEVIEIDRALLEAFTTNTYTAEELASVVFKRTGTLPTNLPAGVDVTLTLGQVRSRALISASQGFIPLVGVIQPIKAFEDPNQLTQTWSATFTALNFEVKQYRERNLSLTTKVLLSESLSPTLTLSGLNNITYPVDMQILATSQWPGRDFLPQIDLDIVANNNFGTWKVLFLNKGHGGYEVLEFSDDALTMLNTTAALNPTATTFSLNITSIDNYQINQTFTSGEILSKLNGGRYLTIPLQAFVRRGAYEYDIQIALTSTVTTSGFVRTNIANKTTVQDDTPADVTVNAKWAIPTTDAELANWYGLNDLPVITKEEYAFSATQYAYTHDVDVKYYNTPYVAAVSIEKTVRERLIENRYPGNTIVGLWDGGTILASDLIDGVLDANGDNLLFVIAPVSVTQDNTFDLSFSISGIADYNKVFSGRDVAVVQASKVIVTKIQNNMDPLIESLRTALNPIADQLMTGAELNATITENGQGIQNIINNVSRDYIGKKWVVPIGVSKKQLENIQTGTWLIVRATGTGIDISVDINQLRQFATEGWVYTDTTDEDEEYIIYPLLFDFEDTDQVKKQLVDINAGLRVGPWTNWFTNYQRQLNFEYSIKTATKTDVEIVRPDAALWSNLTNVRPALPTTTMDPKIFRKETVEFEVDVYSTDIAVQSDVSLLEPIFVRFLTAQLEEAQDTGSIGSVTITPYTLDVNEWKPGTENVIDFTKADTASGLKVGEFTYLQVGVRLESLTNTLNIYHAVFDFDGPDGNWLSGESTLGAMVAPGYNFNCVGALSSLGELEVLNASGTILISKDGDRIDIVNSDDFYNVLRTSFGLTVVELTPYTPPEM